MNTRRRNPSLAEIAAVARQLGKLNLAALLEMGGPVAESLAAEISAAVEEAPAAPTPTRGMLDRDAWLELASIAPTAYAEYPPATVAQIVAAFRSRAAAA